MDRFDNLSEKNVRQQVFFLETVIYEKIGNVG